MFLLQSFLIFLACFLLVSIYFISTTNKKHICRTVGVDLNLSLLAKISNYICSLYYFFFRKHALQIDVFKWCSDLGIKQELQILQKPWGSKTSPILKKNIDDLVSSEEYYYKRYTKLLNNPKGMWSPIGRLFLYITFKEQIENRYVTTYYILERKLNFFYVENNFINILMIILKLFMVQVLIIIIIY